MLGSHAQVVGDDMLVTNPARVKRAIDGKVVNALLLKVNQIGTISESIEAVGMSKAAGWGVMTSHRCASPRCCRLQAVMPPQRRRTDARAS